MKYFSLCIIILSILACKKNHECYVQDENNNNLDTILCNCTKEIIEELESSPYATDSTSYDIICQQK